MALDELREALKLTQESLAESLHVNQAAISKVERRSDMLISTLRKIIQAMGGELEIRAILPAGVVRINQFERVRRPVIFLDTSVVNLLAEDKNAASFISSLRSGYAVRLTAANLDEVAATPDGNEREHLLDVCRATQGEDDTQVFLPVGDIVKALIAEFERNPACHWRAVRVRLPEYERLLASSELISDELSTEQSEFAEKQKAQFDEMYSNARPQFDELFHSGTEGRPSSPAELVSRLQVRGGAFWSFGMKLYTRAAEPPADEDRIRRFVD